MGKFIYNTAANSFEVEDRTLAHLRIVIMNKMRRAESFMFDMTMTDGSGSRSFWMNPGIPIQFQFFGSRNPRINRAWVDLLMTAASSPNGLAIVPEPAQPAIDRASAADSRSAVNALGPR